MENDVFFCTTVVSNDTTSKISDSLIYPIFMHFINWLLELMGVFKGLEPINYILIYYGAV